MQSSSKKAKKHGTVTKRARCNKESKELPTCQRLFSFLFLIWTQQSKQVKRTFNFGLSHLFTFSLIYFHRLIILLPFIFYLIYLHGKKHNNFHNILKFLSKLVYHPSHISLQDHLSIKRRIALKNIKPVW